MRALARLFWTGYTPDRENLEILKSFCDPPTPILQNLRTLKNSAQYRSNCSSLREDLVDEIPINVHQENVGCGLQLTQPAQVGLAAAQMYSTTEAFTHGVAISI